MSKFIQVHLNLLAIHAFICHPCHWCRFQELRWCDFFFRCYSFERCICAVYEVCVWASRLHYCCCCCYVLCVSFFSLTSFEREHCVVVVICVCVCFNVVVVRLKHMLVVLFMRSLAFCFLIRFICSFYLFISFNFIFSFVSFQFFFLVCTFNFLKPQFSFCHKSFSFVRMMTLCYFTERFFFQCWFRCMQRTRFICSIDWIFFSRLICLFDAASFYLNHLKFYLF